MFIERGAQHLTPDALRIDCPPSGRNALVVGRGLWLAVLAASLLAACDSSNLVIGVSPTPTESATPTQTPTATPTPQALTSADVLQPGPAGVGVRTVPFEDLSRSTMRNGTFPGAPTRRLITEVWYPTAAHGAAAPQRNSLVAAVGRPFPLIVYSHGFTSFRTEGAYLARHLASHGYVVAAADYPLSNFLAPGGPNFADVVEQPGDISFIIDAMLARSEDPDDPFHDAIDRERIGFAGLSMGGLTTLLATFHPTLRDPRVRAAVSIAGPGCFFGSSFFETVSLPLLIMHGDLDAIVAYEEHAVAAYGRANPPKYLVTLAGGTHTGFAEAGALFEEENNADDAGCTALGGGREQGEATDLLDRLGGETAGIVAGDCPAACSGTAPLPRGMRPSRQRLLTVLTVFPFFEATLRNDAASRHYLESILAAENNEVHVRLDP